MTDLNNETEYWAEVKDTAECMVTEALEQHDNDRDEAQKMINDTLLHETIDGHEWIIYNGFHLDIIKYTENQDYAVDNFGPECLVDAVTPSGTNTGGLDKIHTVIAFWSFYADVSDKIQIALDEAMEKIEEEAI